MNRQPARAKLLVSTPGDREITMARDFGAPRPLVFDCFTKPDLLQRWLNGPDGWTLAVCEVDFRVGGALRYVWRHRDGREMGMSGVYREIAGPERVTCTELFDEDWTGGEVLTTFVFTETAGSTTVTQSALYSSRAARDGALKTGMTTGIDVSYDQLDAYLATATRPA